MFIEVYIEIMFLGSDLVWIESEIFWNMFETVFVSAKAATRRDFLLLAKKHIAEMSTSCHGDASRKLLFAE